MTRSILRLTLVGLVATSCAKTDLGSPCQLLTPSNVQVSPGPHQNIVQSGNGSCQEFVCTSFNGSQPICSRPCDVEGAACENGLVCQDGLLTPELLKTLQQRTNGTQTTEYQQLTSGMTGSLYCGPKT